jgi:L,D-transpeptidase YcbB
MTPNRVKLLASIAAFAVFVSAADADIVLKKRKPSFFERLFASSKRPKVKPARKGSFFSWLQRDDEVNIIYGNDRSRSQQGYDSDPEPLPTLGMGNLDYVATKPVSIFDPVAVKATAATPAADAIRLEFADSKTLLRVDPAFRSVIASHYNATGYAPLWLSNGTLNSRAKALLQVLADAESEGLVAESYLPGALRDFSEASLGASFDAQTASALDIGLTRSALEYARDVSSGQFDPGKLSLYHDMKPETVNPATLLKVIAYSPFPDAYLKTLVSHHVQYAALRDRLHVLDQEIRATPYEAFEATGKRVKAGQKDSRIPDLRDRMLDIGMLEPGNALVAEASREILDKPLSQALKAFQKSNGIKQTGQIDAATEIVLGLDPRQRQRDKLAINMERLRWIPKDLGRRHVFVNQAAFDVVVRNNGTEVWKSKVIVGRPMTQTAVFNDTIETVVFNPSWGVPQSILVNEYLPKLRREPGYLDRIGFKVVNANGTPISSRSVNWGAYGNKLPFGVQQPPGGDNALGEIKFLFPNAHDIYMHDTPSRQLFDESVRAFSHGCVRVQNPREFATVLLGWQRDKVDRYTDDGESKSVPLPDPYRVHINYFTAWPDETGKITYYSDIYGRDERLLKALDNQRVRQKQRSSLSLLGDTGRVQKSFAQD